MNRSLFNQLSADGYNKIPVSRDILADVDTPVSCFLKLANQPFSFLFESVEGGEKWGRYSIIGLPCQFRYEVRDHCVRRFDGDHCIETQQVADPLKFVSELTQSFSVPELPDMPRFHGGLVCYFAYDTIRYIEPRLDETERKPGLGTPDIVLLEAQDVLVFDNLSGTIKVITHVDPSEAGAFDKAHARISDIERSLSKSLVSNDRIRLDSSQSLEDSVNYHFDESDFKRAIDDVKDYVLAGDVMQVVLSQRMSMPFAHDPTDLYRALRVLNPSPYMYCLNLGDHHVIGSSPEILARLEENEVTVRPIAGTRRRGKSEQEDQALERELVADPKEIAEHLMLIDLGRNDVGRIAQTGTVSLTEKMKVERYSHVMHITSNVTGQLKEGLNCMDVLKATMPAGTLSGAPKVRAMEIIQQLEPEERGIYGGAVGYISWSGNMDTAIAIRTAVVKDQTLYVQAGAGVVADSIDELEWKETRNKARAILVAASMLASGDES